MKKDSSRKTNIFFYEVQYICNPGYGTSESWIGIGKKFNTFNTEHYSDTYSYSLGYNGNHYENGGSAHAYTRALRDRDTIGVLLNLDKGTIEYVLDGVSTGKPAST